MKKSKYSGYPVLHDSKLVGMISRDEIIRNSKDDELKIKLIGDIASLDLVTVYPDQSLLLAFDKMKKFHVGRIAVIGRFDRHELVGILTAEDIVSHFGYHIGDNK